MSTPPPTFGPPRTGASDLERAMPPSPSSPTHPLLPPSQPIPTPPHSPEQPSPQRERETYFGQGAAGDSAPAGNTDAVAPGSIGSSSMSRRIGLDALAGDTPIARPTATRSHLQAPTATQWRSSLASQRSGVSAAHMTASTSEDGSLLGLGEGGAHSISFAPSLKSDHQAFTRPYSPAEALRDEKMHTFAPGEWRSSSSNKDRATFRMLSLRGWLNAVALLVIVVGLIAVFAGLPIANWAILHVRKNTLNAFNLGGFHGNSTGQVAEISGFSGLIDPTTPEDAMTRVGHDGNTYNLQFSDEFNTDGRTFWPDDDPYWEAVDFHYWATGDLEWYDPDAIITRDGNLVITMTKESINGLDYKSGMLQSWNKLCFTGGYIEISASFPGKANVPGFWPGAWTLGNLGRAGYGATTDGTWPYSYSSCDVGTLPNQTTVDGTGPPAAVKLTDGLPLSYQPGQRLSACTCRADAKEHPGPNVKVGRGAPEIDILEAQTHYTNRRLVGAVSQSAQFAPYDNDYQIRNTTPYTVVHSPNRTILNDYLGGIYQQACSGVTVTDQTAYQDSGGSFATYGFEYMPGQKDGYITWYTSGEPAWTLTAGAVGPNAATGVGQRLIAEEPMSIILNLGMSTSFQHFDPDDLVFPAEMLIDYVRIYQREGEENIGCDPPKMPTSDYIEKPKNAYTDPLLTTWAQAGYDFPRNSMQGC
ncbi:hypothetical protein JCM10908_003078 [Rhodotorula pacifica]|uniref:SKN1/KRE6 family beta-glucan synthesis-associated protein n=1 Tax=Rhodotorula pacifica TaxID=1495444 RepID=UPI0031736942